MFESTDKNNCTSYRVIHENPPLNISFYSFGERLFSMLTPQYERYLMEEIYGLRCVVKLTLDEIMDMPVADRRLFIQLHNQRIEKENSGLDNNTSTKDGINEVKNLVDKANSKKEQK